MSDRHSNLPFRPLATIWMEVQNVSMGGVTTVPLLSMTAVAPWLNSSPLYRKCESLAQVQSWAGHVSPPSWPSAALCGRANGKQPYGCGKVTRAYDYIFKTVHMARYKFVYFLTRLHLLRWVSCRRHLIARRPRELTTRPGVTRNVRRMKRPTVWCSPCNYESGEPYRAKHLPRRSQDQAMRAWLWQPPNHRGKNRSGRTRSRHRQPGRLHFRPCPWQLATGHVETAAPPRPTTGPAKDGRAVSSEVVSVTRLINRSILDRLLRLQSSLEVAPRAAETDADINRSGVTLRRFKGSMSRVTSWIPISPGCMRQAEQTRLLLD